MLIGVGILIGLVLALIVGEFRKQRSTKRATRQFRIDCAATGERFEPLELPSIHDGPGPTVERVRGRDVARRMGAVD